MNNIDFRNMPLLLLLPYIFLMFTVRLFLYMIVGMNKGDQWTKWMLLK